MAFIEFTDTAPAGLPIALFAVPRGASRDPEQIAVTITEPLSQLERRVVDLAREDGIDTLKPPRKRSWLGRLILGSPAPSPVLANERLEALRRLAVYAWQDGYLLPASALADAKTNGLNETEISAVIDQVARSRPAVRRLAA